MKINAKTIINSFMKICKEQGKKLSSALKSFKDHFTKPILFKSGKSIIISKILTCAIAAMVVVLIVFIGRTVVLKQDSDKSINATSVNSKNRIEGSSGSNDKNAASEGVTSANNILRDELELVEEGYEDIPEELEDDNNILVPGRVVSSSGGGGGGGSSGSSGEGSSSSKETNSETNSNPSNEAESRESEPEPETDKTDDEKPSDETKKPVEETTGEGIEEIKPSDMYDDDNGEKETREDESVYERDDD